MRHAVAIILLAILFTLPGHYWLDQLPVQSQTAAPPGKAGPGPLKAQEVPTTAAPAAPAAPVAAGAAGAAAPGPTVIRQLAAPGTTAVPGLALPPSQTVNLAAQPVIAVCAVTAALEVRWLVDHRGKLPPQLLEMPQQKTLLVLPQGADVITVYADAIVAGKPTAFARTTYTVQTGPVGPGPQPVPPKPSPTPPTPTPPAPTPPNELPPLPAGTKLHVTVILDPGRATPGQRALENSPTLRDTMVQAGHKLHILSTTQKPVIEKADLWKYLVDGEGKLTASAYLILQVASARADNDGEVRFHGPLPATEQGILDAIVKTLADR